MSPETNIVPKDFNQYKGQVLSVQKAANDLVVASAEDMARATDLLSQVKKVKDFITERKEEITKPLMASLASSRDLFKPLELGHIEAEKTIKAKMLSFSIEDEERKEKEKNKIAGRVAKGTMRADTAAGKMENIGSASKNFAGAEAKSSIREVTKMRVTDENLIPREYLVPDMAKLTEAVIKNKIDVPGTETYKEKSIVAR